MLTCLVSLVPLGISASTAQAQPVPGTGWEAFSSVAPSNLQSGLATNEVQEIAAEREEIENPKTGMKEKDVGLTLSFGNKTFEQGRVSARFAMEPFAGILGVSVLTASNVQKFLEEKVYGKGNVSVSESAAPEGVPHFLVRAVGEDAGQEMLKLLIGFTAGEARIVTAGHPDGTIQLDIFNIGAKPSNGPVTVTDTLPAGLTATRAGGMGLAEATRIYSSSEEEELTFKEKAAGAARWVCRGSKVVTCTSNPAVLPSLPNGQTGRESKTDLGIAHIQERIGIAVAVEEGATSGTVQNRVTVSGGGAASEAVASDPVTIGASEPGFGFSGWDVWFSNADGTTDTQAGSHPYEATFALGFDQLANGNPAGGEARDMEAVLPAGFFGDPGAVPECTRTQLNAHRCPAQSQIGIDAFAFATSEGARPGAEAGAQELIAQGVYNMVPPPGVPDEFAFALGGYPVFFDAGVRSGGGYGLVAHIDDIPQAEVVENVLTLWGVPAEASHDLQRNMFPECANGCSSGVIPKPFLTLPTSCAGAQLFAIRGLSTWQNPDASAEASVLTHDGTGAPAGFTGCQELTIEPSLTAVPDTGFADTPAGLNVEVKVPQENLTNPEGTVAATLKNTTVTLPEGVVVNPGQAAGLQACGEAEANIHGEGPQSCPLASKVGTVKIQTPLLEGELESELEGNVYVLQSNPPELKLLVAASGDGIYLKLPGTVHLNEATGQLTTTFEETPELPFTSFKLSFSGGAQAALATPTRCGTYTTDSVFTPWTSPFGAEVPGSDSFLITNGSGGAPCPSGALPFSPELVAGATTDQAGGYTDFSLLLRRGDGQQRIDGLRFKAPEGLTGFLSNVPLCTNAQAEANACPAASKIGHTVVESGPGPYPLVVPEPGQEPAPIYLTESYDGAPFGLAIVVPLHVGPFTLPTQRVRARIEVDPTTSALTVTTNPLPQVVAGVPTDLREIDAVIERPEFMVNPTNCSPSEFSGTAYGTAPPGQSEPSSNAAISSHFQVGSCQSLKFEPKFSVSTSGKTSKSDGASLTAKVSYPDVPQGTDADIAKVKVELPKQLPSRLTTLQKACTAAQFEANPAGCPPASFIGHAVVHTPLLPVVLEGPAIFVSHGGEAFPSLEIVLQGDGVTVDLVGATFISKTGITSTTFKTVPDDPFNTFELTLPEGPYSALAANGNLCAETTTKTVKKKVTVKVKGHKKTETRNVKQTEPATLQMPNEFVGQNGATVKQTTPVSVTGCPKAVRHERKKKHTKKKKK